MGEHRIQADGDEFLLRQIQADSNVGDFIHPFQQVAAKQVYK